MVLNKYDAPPSDFLKIFDGNLTEDFCRFCIEKFEVDERKYQGEVSLRVDLDIKDSIDLRISGLNGWEAADAIFEAQFREPAREYLDFLVEMCVGIHSPYDSGYQIQRTLPGGGYDWHNDSSVEPNGDHRLFTYIWYLNTITDGSGYTEFFDGTRIQPVAGRLILFPSTWTWVHRGIPPATGKKYIATGWMYTQFDHSKFYTTA
jgi:hypothetical protein